MEYKEPVVMQIIEVFEQDIKIEYAKYHIKQRFTNGKIKDEGENKTYIATVVYFGLTNEGETIPLVVEDGKIKPVWKPYKLIEMNYMSRIVKTEGMRRL